MEASLLRELKFKKYVWSVDSNEEIYEAKIGLGGYHGYRLGEDDAMRKVVLEAWKIR